MAASPRERLLKHSERYKEIVEWMGKLAAVADSRDLTDEERKQLSSAFWDAMKARMKYRGIICSIKAKGENADHLSMIGDLPTEIDPLGSNIPTVLLKILERSESTNPRSSSEKVNRLVREAGCYSHLAEVKTGPEREKAVENALSIFEAAEISASRYLAPYNLARLELAVKFSDFYYRILKSPDGACRIAKQAVDKAMPQLASLDKCRRKMAAEGKLDTPKPWKESPAARHMHVLGRNITRWTIMMQGFGSGFRTRSNSSSLSLSVTMASLREELVKQDERYKEMVALMEKIATAADSGLLTNEERRHLKSAYFNAMNARIASRDITSLITSKQEEENGEHVSMIPAEIYPSCSDITTVLVKVLDSREIPYAASGLAKVVCLRKKARYCKELAEVKTGADREEAVKNVLSIFKAAQDIAHADLAPSHPERLGLAVEFSVFYYDILNSPDDACDIAKQALDEAMAGSSGLEGELAALRVGRLDTPIEEYDKYRVVGKMGELRRNIALWKIMMQRKREDDEDEAMRITKQHQIKPEEDKQ